MTLLISPYYLHCKLVPPRHPYVELAHGVEIGVDWKDDSEPGPGLVHEHWHRNHGIISWFCSAFKINLVISKHELTGTVCVEEHAIFVVRKCLRKHNLPEEHICAISKVVECLTRLDCCREHILLQVLLREYGII